MANLKRSVDPLGADLVVELHFNAYKSQEANGYEALHWHSSKHGKQAADAFIDSICLIEWAQRLGPYLPRTALNIFIQPDPEESDTRTISLSGGDRWQSLLAEIEAGIQTGMKGVS